MVEYIDKFCHDLGTTPVTDKKILVTGATGYIGGELVPELLARGYKVRAIVRNLSVEYQQMWPGVEIFKCDMLNLERLKLAMEGIHVAYYLVHSLHLVGSKFMEIDNLAADNFRRAAEACKVERIIYLGGLGDPETDLSDHLRSRYLVGEELKKGKIPVTFLRAAVIVGAGSSSYRIINKLIENCPIFVFPKKANALCQPIAVRDVIKYLVGCLEIEETKGKTYDIGGPDIHHYLDMLKIQAKVINKKRIFITTNFSLMPVYARVGSLFTPVKYGLIKSLMESCVNDVVCRENEIERLIPLEKVSFQEALQRALVRKPQRILYVEKNKTATSEMRLIKSPRKISPPKASKGLVSDVKNFLINKPSISTLNKFDSLEARSDYNYRIMQRLGINVEEYGILNIHKIGVNTPAKYVFEELLKWDGDSTCWPNHIAMVDRTNNTLESLSIYLFGWKNLPGWLAFFTRKHQMLPLFNLNAIKINGTPVPGNSDNERYLLYKCEGGYPIGIFSMYVRSGIPEENENELSQLFLVVSFNFYGHQNWSKLKILNRIWESIHNRVTSNVLNRIKQLSEWRFEKIKSG
jgi:uncharacterized protein YbjT (DUF2867 family)